MARLAETSVKKNETELSLFQLVVSNSVAKLHTAASKSAVQTDESTYIKYKDDPVGFIRDVLREDITEDAKKLARTCVTSRVVQARSANSTGKTHVAARIIIWAYKCHKNVQVYTAAAPPEENLRRLLWGEISSVVEKNPGLFLGDKTKLTSMDISRSALERVVGVTIPQTGDNNQKMARFSGKHAGYLVFILDEADAIPECIYTAIESCMSGQDGFLLCLFNPRAKSGPLWVRESRGEARTIVLSAMTHPNVVTGKNIFPGAVSRETTCRRISAWTRPLYPGEGPLDGDTFIVPDFLVGYRAVKREDDNGDKEYYPAIRSGVRKIIEPEFSYMVLGQYSSLSENQLISRDDCERAVERWRAHVRLFGEVPPIPCKPVGGLDVAEFGKDKNVLTFRYKDWVAPQSQWGGVDIKATGESAARQYHDKDCEMCHVDSNGVGAGVWPIMRDKGCATNRVMVQEKPTELAIMDGEILGQFDMIRDQGWWTLREWLRTNPKVMLPEEALLAGGLIDQLTAPTYSKTLSGKIKVSNNDIISAKLRNTSPDHATSLMLTFCPIVEDEESGELHSYKWA